MAFIYNVAFDAREPRRLGRFWSAVTGYGVAEERDDFVRLRAPDSRGIRHILFFKVDDPTPGKNRVHVAASGQSVGWVRTPSRAIPRSRSSCSGSVN